MVKENQRTGTSSRILPLKSVKVFQRVTGNEGPSPLMKRYLKSRQKRELVGTNQARVR
jgi:hypothetical protein